jgi:hypothetical protein
MSTVRQYSGEDTHADEAGGTGWVLFAGSMLALLGTLNVVQGIAAISNSAFFVEDARYVFAGLNTWGWVLLATGVTQGLTGLGVFARIGLARWLGVLIATLNAAAQMLMLPAYPLWSMTMFAVNLFVIYGLVAHGGRSAR